MSKQLNFMKVHASNPKVLGAVVVIGVTVTGFFVLAEARRRRRRLSSLNRDDCGAFLEKFVIFPFPQPPIPAVMLPLTGLTFAMTDIFHVKDHVTGFGNPDWARLHELEEITSTVVVELLKSGATCVGKTVMDEFAFGKTGENVHYGTPTNPIMPEHVPGGSSSGSAVAVAAELVDFALSVDICGCIRIPAAFCGVLGYRSSHGCVLMSGVLPNSPCLESVGWFARDPIILHAVGHVLLQLNAVEPRRDRCLIIADDLFQLSKVPKQKTEHVISKVIESMSGYLNLKHLNFGQYIASEVSSLDLSPDQPRNGQTGVAAMEALSRTMTLLQKYEFKIKHGDWLASVKLKLPPDIHLQACEENLKKFYKIKTEMRDALQSLLKDNKILVLPTVADPPPKLGTKKKHYSESLERARILSCIASLSGCCQVAIPLGIHDGVPISISLITYHGGDKFLLDTVLELYSSLQTQASVTSNSAPIPDESVDVDASDILKEKGNAAFKRRQFDRAVGFYSEAIKINASIATYYCNRAAAYLEMGCFQKSEDDCSKAISLNKKNVKAYLRRGAARESLSRYKEAVEDFKHALVLEPQNRAASVAEMRLRSRIS